MKRLLACAALALLFAQSAQAQSWTGCYLGVNAGMAASTSKSSLDIAGVGTLLDIDSLGASGGVAGVGGGCDLKVGGQLVVGAFGDYVWHNQETTIGVPLAGLQLARLTADTQWTIGGRAGLLFRPDTLVYGLVGWTRMDSSDLTLLNAALTASVPTFEGWTFGGGIETTILPNITLSAEYRYARFDRVDAAIVPGLSMGIQPDMHTATARLNYRFDLLGGGATTKAPLK